MKHRRADAALAEAGHFSSREQAKAAILAGRVSVCGVRVLKAGQDVPPDVVFTVEPAREFVSRGGHKLAGALDRFGLDVSGLSALDVGASTGGFTDCLLQRGAISVTDVDVGYGQLAWALRNDPRVTVLERTNIRGVQDVLPGGPFGIVVIDVSFVGLAKVLPAVALQARPGTDVLALVKPQFEAGKGRVGKRGVVRDAAVHLEVIETVVEQVSEQGWSVDGLTWSPITGPEGNIEFWMLLNRRGAGSPVDPASVVAEAHEAFRRS